MKQTILELKDVWKTYQIGKIEVNAIKKANLKIYRGEFVIIIGSSGSGKSTAMNLIGCLDLPSKGAVLFDGIDITSLSKSKIAKIRGRKIGFVFQQFNLIPTLNSLENVMLPMEFQEFEKCEERARKLLELVGLKDRIKHKPKELSGGQAQRVSIARSLANNPEIILADEPTGNLDTKTGKYIINFLYQLHKKEGKTLIIVTHDMTLVSKMKKNARIVKLQDGEII
ncbi:MAG: ABC transporter ATP-binding protein [Candidatus Woesearchaeota archaeon]|jgi:putative ABC transport system ATP-binding protein